MSTTLGLLLLALALLAAAGLLLRPPADPEPLEQEWSDEHQIVATIPDDLEAFQWRSVSRDFGLTWSSPVRVAWPWFVRDDELPWTP